MSKVMKNTNCKHSAKTNGLVDKPNGLVDKSNGLVDKPIEKTFILKNFSPVAIKTIKYPVQFCSLCRGYLTQVCSTCMEIKSEKCDIVSNDNIYYHSHCYDLIKKSKK